MILSKVKPIFGVEAYFISSVKEWKKEYELAKQDKKEARKLENKTGNAAWKSASVYDVVFESA